MHAIGRSSNRRIKCTGLHPIDRSRALAGIHHLIVPVANASRSNPQGVAVSGNYLVRNGSVVICDEHGVAKGDSRKIGKDENHRVIAARLLKKAWEAADGGDFNRPLSNADYDTWKY